MKINTPNETPAFQMSFNCAQIHHMHLCTEKYLHTIGFPNLSPLRSSFRTNVKKHNRRRGIRVLDSIISRAFHQNSGFCARGILTYTNIPAVCRHIHPGTVSHDLSDTIETLSLPGIHNSDISYLRIYIITSRTAGECWLSTEMFISRCLMHARTLVARDGKGDRIASMTNDCAQQQSNPLL
ncbi:hypothetical protein QE152_g8624 [Popillia japonica]|uniref:Uncharacterized protein n=1 Tax=Popillia japonica TaxID=7064 RepID=A0AAW1M3T0_POPJA